MSASHLLDTFEKIPTGKNPNLPMQIPDPNFPTAIDL